MRLAIVVNLLRGERIGVGGNEKWSSGLAKGRKDWGGETLLLFFI